MKSLFVVLLFCLCGYAYASKCKTQEETDYAKMFVDKICPKLKQDANIDNCYEGKGITVKNFQKGCEDPCDGKDKDASIEDECCFIRNMVDAGKTIADKKAADDACAK